MDGPGSASRPDLESLSLQDQAAMKLESGIGLGLMAGLAQLPSASCSEGDPHGRHHGARCSTAPSVRARRGAQLSRREKADQLPRPGSQAVPGVGSKASTASAAIGNFPAVDRPSSSIGLARSSTPRQGCGRSPGWFHAQPAPRRPA